MNEEVQRYIDALPEERRPLFEKLQGLIMSLCPNAEVLMWYRMPTYRIKPGWVALANQKHYVSLYTNGAHHIADFKARYPRIKTGAGCINLKVIDEFPVSALRKVIRHAMEHPKP